MYSCAAPHPRRARALSRRRRRSQNRTGFKLQEPNQASFLVGARRAGRVHARTGIDLIPSRRAKSDCAGSGRQRARRRASASQAAQTGGPCSLCSTGPPSLLRRLYTQPDTRRGQFSLLQCALLFSGVRDVLGVCVRTLHSCSERERQKSMRAMRPKSYLRRPGQCTVWHTNHTLASCIPSCLDA
jgi:hypothetical protein